MKTKKIYAIKIEEINSDFTTYRLWKNGQDIDPGDLTTEEMKLFQKELFDFSEMFRKYIKYFKEL